MKTVSKSIRGALFRRLLIGAVMLPPIVGVTSIEKEEKPHAKMVVHSAEIVIPGSASYLDPNPSF